MRRLLLVLAALLVTSSLVSAQVIDNFNNGLAGFTIQSGTNGMDSIAAVPGPVNKSNGVMAMYFNFAAGGYANGQQHGSVGISNVPADGAQYIVYYVYLPSGENLPDSLEIQAFCQSKYNNQYPYETKDYFAYNIPRDKWFPIYFPLNQTSIKVPTFNVVKANINTLGLQVFPTEAAWKGVIYVDNVALVGAKPTVITNFKNPGSGTPGNGNAVDGYYVNLQYSSDPLIDSIYQQSAVTDTAGTSMNALGVAVNVDSTDTAASGGMWIGWSGLNVNSGSNLLLQMWVYIPVADSLPSDSSVSLQLYCQTKPSYHFSFNGFNVQAEIPVGVWYPIYFPFTDSAIAYPSVDSLTGQTGDLNSFGIQVYRNGPLKTLKYHGTFYIADVSLLGILVPKPVWLAAGFKSKGTGVGNGLNGFEIPSFAKTGTIAAYSDLIHGGLYTMKGTMSLSKATPLFAAVRDSVPMDDSLGDNATGISMNVLLPSGMPSHGVVKVYVSGGANDSAGVADTIGSQIMTGSFTKVMVPGLDSLATAGKFDPGKPAQIGIEVYYPGAYDTTAWSGSIEVDSVFVYGISRSGTLPPGNGSVTGIQTAGNNLPRQFKLYNNYPNPFNPSTQIEYSLPQASKVVLQVYDVLGQRVATLVDAKQAAGTYHISFNMDNYASGVYFLRMQAGNYVHVQKMMLLK